MKTNSYSIVVITAVLSFFFTGIQNVSAQKKKKESAPGEYKSLKEALSADPKTVIKLDLSKQGLKEVPQEIFAFTYLQQLDISNNKLTQIPENISDFKYLTYLNISKNKITTLPESIGKFHQLNSFKMSQNKITTLPAGFFHLTSLEIIDFYSNPLVFDPMQFKKLEKRIKYIDIRNTALSPEACQQLREVLPNAKIKCDKGCNCQ